MPRTCLEVCKIQCLALECALNLEELSRHWGAQWSWSLIEGVASCPSYPSCSVSAGSKATKRCSATGMGDPSSMPRPLEEFQLAKHFLAFDTIYRHYISANITGGGFRGFNCSGCWPAILPVPTMLHLALNSPLPLATPQQNLRDGHLWRSKSTSPMSLLAGRQHRRMQAAHPQPYLLNIQNLKRQQAHAFKDQALSQLESHQHQPVASWDRRGAFKSRLCRLLTLSKTCKPRLSH